MVGSLLVDSDFVNVILFLLEYSFQNYVSKSNFVVKHFFHLSSNIVFVMV